MSKMSKLWSMRPKRWLQWNLYKYAYNYIRVTLWWFNLFKLNILSHPYQLGESTSNLRCEDCFYCFFFFFNFRRVFCQHTVKTQTRSRMLLRLIWVFTVCLHPIERMPGLYGFNTLSWYVSYHVIEIIGHELLRVLLPLPQGELCRLCFS